MSSLLSPVPYRLILVVPESCTALSSWVEHVVLPSLTHEALALPKVSCMGVGGGTNTPIALCVEGVGLPQAPHDALRVCQEAWHVHQLPLDWALIEGDTSELRKKLLVSDMDSTLLQGECIDELAEVVGLKPKVADITARAMRGELPFEPALRERVALLKGIPVSVIESTLARLPYMPGAKTLCATMKHHAQATLVLVSGGFTLFTGAVVNALGMDAQYSNVLGVCPETHTLTGEVSGDPTLQEIVGQQTKLQVLKQYTQRLGLASSQTLAVGDGANDLAMICHAGMGVAYHAKPLVAQQAQYGIHHTDLTTLLYFQGYTQAEFVHSSPVRFP
ncbi:MAG: phosphoserine phosphatase SerB [Vampirovibrionales bacterium]